MQEGQEFPCDVLRIVIFCRRWIVWSCMFNISRLFLGMFPIDEKTIITISMLIYLRPHEQVLELLALLLQDGGGDGGRRRVARLVS